MDSCDLFAFIFVQCYFTGAGAICDCPNATEGTLKNMGKILQFWAKTNSHHNQVRSKFELNQNKLKTQSMKWSYQTRSIIVANSFTSPIRSLARSLVAMVSPPQCIHCMFALKLSLFTVSLQIIEGTSVSSNLQMGLLASITPLILLENTECKHHIILIKTDFIYFGKSPWVY